MGLTCKAKISDEVGIYRYLNNFDIELDTKYHIYRVILEREVWELAVVLYINLFVKPGDVCIDVGANAGYQTLAMGKGAGPSGKVIAFEPNREIHPKLKRNLELNKSILAPI